LRISYFEPTFQVLSEIIRRTETKVLLNTFMGIGHIESPIPVGGIKILSRFPLMSCKSTVTIVLWHYCDTCLSTIHLYSRFLSQQLNNSTMSIIKGHIIRNPEPYFKAFTRVCQFGRISTQAQNTFVTKHPVRMAASYNAERIL